MSNHPNDDCILIAEEIGPNIINIRVRIDAKDNYLKYDSVKLHEHQTVIYPLSLMCNGQSIKKQWYDFLLDLKNNIKAALFYKYKTDKEYETWLITQNGTVSLSTYQNNILVTKHCFSNNKFKKFFEESINYIIDDIDLDEYIKKSSKSKFKNIKRVLSNKLLKSENNNDNKFH